MERLRHRRKLLGTTLQPPPPEPSQSPPPDNPCRTTTHLCHLLLIHSFPTTTHPDHPGGPQYLLEIHAPRRRALRGGSVRGHSPYRTPTHRNIIPIHRNIIPALRNTILIYLSALHFLSFYVHSTPFPSLPSPFSIYIPLGHLVRVSSVYSLRNSLTRSVSCT